MIRPTVRRLSHLRRWSDHDFCGELDAPGVRIDEAALVDYTTAPTTPDQVRIEEVLATRDLTRARLLHVGVGDSGLARRFSGKVASIDGITVSDNELAHAERAGLPGYHVQWINKHTRDLVLKLQPGYDVIVDNNPASFVCCGYHLAVLFDNYRWALRPGGELLTARGGLRWVAGDARWRMRFADLSSLGARFGLEALRVNDEVYALRRS